MVVIDDSFVFLKCKKGITEIESVSSRNIMDADVVCISDDDEQREEEASASLKTATNKMRNLGFHYNVYENSYYVPESARIQLELLQKQKEQQQQQQHRQQQQQIKDVPKEVVVYVPDDGEEEVLLMGPIRKLARQILFGDKLCAPPTEFPYSILLQLEQHLAKSLRNVSFTTETSVWNCTIEQLSCIKIAYSGLIDLKADPKFNLIIIRILSQYVNFRARLTAANKSLLKDQIKEICKEIWLQLEILLSNNFVYIIMVLLRTDAKDYPLDVVLYPLFEKTHELMLRGRHKRQSFPEILHFILTVLFYKHWQLMFTEREDRRKHIAIAKLSITKYFQKMPENVEKKYEGFIRRVDDRIHHSSLYKTTAYQLFGCKFEVTKAINNFFREYDWFVFVFVDCDTKCEKVAASSRAHSLTTPATHQRALINSQSLASHNKQLNQQQRTKSATATAPLMRSSPSPAPSINSACLSNSLFSSSNISNNNNLSKSSFKNTTTTTTTNDTDNSNRLNSSNFKNSIVGGNDDDDSDDIIIIDAHDTGSASTARATTNGAAAINNFDENANFSSATSPLTRPQDDDSSSTRQLPMNRARLKSIADAEKDDLNFSNFDDSKHASSSDSFRRFFTSKTVLDGGMVTDTSATLIIDEQRTQAEQSVADTTSMSACVDNGSRRPVIDLPAITNKLNGLRCSTDIKVSSSDPVANKTPTDVDVDMERPKLVSVTLSEQPQIKLVKCVPPSALFDRVDVAKVVQPELNASEVYRPTLALPETSRTQTQTNSKTIDESDPLIIDDSMSRCSLDDFGGTSESASKDVPVMGAQRVFNAVPTYDDGAIVLKYRSVSPYFEQEHQKEQQKTSTSKQSVCDSHERNALKTTTKTKLTEVVSSSTSTTIDNQRHNIMISRRSTRDCRKPSYSNDQVPTISSNENFLSAALVDSGIASPGDEAVSKDTLINVPTSTMADECLPSTSKSNGITETPLRPFTKIDLNQVEKNFFDGLFCDTKSLPLLPRKVSFKTAFTSKRLNGFRVEKSVQPKIHELPTVDAVPEKSASKTETRIETVDISSTILEKPVEAKESTSAAVAENKLPSNESEMEIDAHEEPKLSACAETFERAVTEESMPTITASESIQISVESKDETGVEPEPEVIHEEIDSKMQTKGDEIVDEPVSGMQPTTTTANVESSEHVCDKDVVPASPQQETPDAIVEKEIDSQQTGDVEMEVVHIAVEQKEIPSETMDGIEVASISLERQIPETNFEQQMEQEAESQQKPDEILELTISTKDPIPKEATESAIEQQIDEVVGATVSTEDPIPETLVDEEAIESAIEQVIDEVVELAISTEHPIPETVVDEEATESALDQEIDGIEVILISTETRIPEATVEHVVEKVVELEDEPKCAQESEEIRKQVIPEEAEPQRPTDEIIEADISTEPEMIETEEKISESEIVPNIDEIEESHVPSESQISEANVLPDSKREIAEEKISLRKTDETVEATEDQLPEAVIVEDFTESEIVQKFEEAEIVLISSTTQMSEANVEQVLERKVEQERELGIDVEMSETNVQQVVEQKDSEENELEIDEEMPDTNAQQVEQENEIVQNIEGIVLISSTSQMSEPNVDQVLERKVEQKRELGIDEEMSETNVQQVVEQKDSEENELEIDEEMPDTNAQQIVEQENKQVHEEERVEEIHEEVESQQKIDEIVDASVPTESQMPEAVVAEDATESKIEQKIDQLEDAQLPSELQIPEANVEQLIEQEEVQEREQEIDQEIPKTTAEQTCGPQCDQEIHEETEPREKADQSICDLDQLPLPSIAVESVDSETHQISNEVVETPNSEPIQPLESTIESTEKLDAMEVVPVRSQSELTEEVMNENSESHLEIVEPEVPSVSRQQKTPETNEETTQDIVEVEELAIAEIQWPEKGFAEEEIESDIQSDTIDIAAPCVEEGPAQTIVLDEQETEIDLIDEITCDEIPNGPIEIDECTQEMPSPAEEAFTAPLVADLEEINATAEKIRVEFESTKSVAHLDSTVEIDDEVMLESEILSVEEQPSTVHESITLSQNVEKVVENVVAEESAQSIEVKHQTDLLPKKVIAIDAVSTVVEQQITEAAILSVQKIVAEDAVVKCSTSEIESKPYDDEDIVLMDIVCHIAERRPNNASDETMPTDDRSEERIIPEDGISSRETIADESMKTTDTAVEPKVALKKVDQATAEHQKFVTPIIESMERMEISSDDLPTPAEAECEKEISSIGSTVPASAVEEIPPSLPHQIEEVVRTIKIPEPINISPIRHNEKNKSRPAMIVEPVAIFAARHFEIQEHAIDFSLKSAEPIEIIPIDAELPTATIIENISSRNVKPAEPTPDASSGKSTVEATAIPETNSTSQSSIQSLQTIPFINIVPAERDTKPKVEKRSGKSGRRTKPTKMVKVNHLNENTLREMCEKTSENPMIDNLNVLVEVALADQIKNMPGVSVTVKSIQEIEEVANIPSPSVIISPSTMVSTAHSKSISIKPAEPIIEIVPVPAPIVEQSAPAIQKKDEPTKKRWEKAENIVRKSARIKTKEKKNELFEDAFEDVDRALLKLRKMTEKRKAIIFRAVDTIKEISPYKEQPQPPVVIEERKAKSTETYVQKPVREKSIKSFKRPNSKPNDAKKSKPAPITEKKKVPALVVKATAMLPPPPPPPRPSTPTLEEKSGPEILTALNLTAIKNPSKRTSSDVFSVAPLLPNDEVSQPIEETQQHSKKIKSIDVEIESNGIEGSVEPITPTPLDEVLRSTDNSSSSCAKTLFSTPTKDIKNRLTNGHSGSGAAAVAVAGDSSPCAKRQTIENDENKYMSPLVMKKTFECKCNSDRDRILKRLKEFDKVFQPISSDDDVIGLITETIPNDYMETRTTLIRIKKIFYQRFVNVMQQKSLGNSLYLTQMQQQLAGFSQNVSIDNKIFDDVVEWYGNMKDEMRAKNAHTVKSVDLFTNFDRFLKWWGRKFKCYCTPIQNKKCSRKFYDTEESISSDSNSQDRNYSPAKASPTNKFARNIDEMTASASSELFVDFTIPSDVDEMTASASPELYPASSMPTDVDEMTGSASSESFPCITMLIDVIKMASPELFVNETQNMLSNVEPVQEPTAVVPDSIKATVTTDNPKLPESEPASESSLPIDAANTIISFPNPFVSDSIDVAISEAVPAYQSIGNNDIDRTTYESGLSFDSIDVPNSTAVAATHSIENNGIDRTTYENEDSLLMLPSFDLNMSYDTMNFPDQLAQLDLQLENTFDAKSMDMDHATTIPMFPDVENDALASSTPQKLNEIMLQNEIDHYSDDKIFYDFKREYDHPTDPTMGPSKKCYAERPLSVEETVSSLNDNDLTPMPLSNNGPPTCAPLAHILDPCRIPKKASAEYVAYEDHTQSNQLGNCNGNENGFDNLSDFAYVQDLSDFDDDNISYFYPVVPNTSENNNIENVASDMSVEVDVNQPMSECVKEHVVDEDTSPTTNVEYEQHESPHHTQHVERIVTMSEEQTVEQTELPLEEIIVYDPEDSSTEDMEFLKSDYELNKIVPDTPAVEALPTPPPKKSTNDDFHFKQPTLYPNGPTAKTHSSKHSSKSHKSKRKYHDDDSDAPTKKRQKFDDLKEATSSSSHRDTSSSGSSISGGASSIGSQHHHKKSTHHALNYYVTRIKCVDSQSRSPSQSLPRSSISENGDEKLTRGSHHHNGSNKISSKDLKLKIKKLSTDDPTKSNESQIVTSANRRDSKKYHHSVSTSKLYEEAQSRKSHHSSSRKSSGSSRSLHKSNQHWQVQVLK